YAIFFSVLVGISINVNAKSYFQEQYKQIIVRNMVGTLIDTCTLPKEYEEQEKEWNYHASKRVSNRRMTNAGLFSLKHKDQVRGKDHKARTIAANTVQFATLSLYERTDKPPPSQKQRRPGEPAYKGKFNGVLFVGDFNRRFAGQTLLR